MIRHSPFRLCGLTLLGALASPFLAATAFPQTPGTQDTSFATGPVANSSVNALALQPNGQVVVGGIFTTFRGESRNGLARLNADGSLDTFCPGLAISSGPAVNALALQADGQVLAGGSFSVENQPANGGVVRLNADGSLDPSFNVGSGATDEGAQVGSVLALAVTASGQILVGGDFVTFNGTQINGIVQLNTDGSVDSTFNPGGAGISGDGRAPEGQVSSIVVLANGQILIGGDFNTYNGTAAGSVARLNADGTLDTTFNVGTGVSEGVNALAVQANGLVLVAGDFDTFDGVSVNGIVRLNTDGSLDTSYDPSPGDTAAGIDSVIVQPDGSAVVGGTFLDESGLVSSPAGPVLHLLADGTQDASFDTTSIGGEGKALALQVDGNLLIGSNNPTNFFGAPGDVYRAFDVAATTSNPVVTIAAGVAEIDEDSGTPATLILTLSAVQTSNIVVAYTVKGKAQSGVDYQPLKGTAKIKAGKTTKAIKVFPIDRGLTGGGKASVKLTLSAGAGYTVGTPDLAKVKIIDND